MASLFSILKPLGKTCFGLSALYPEWRRMAGRESLSDDILAGVTVAFVAVPLSLAIALASGVSPAVGLVTSIVAGIVAALFGGTPLAVTGPAAAMAVLVASTVEKHGVGGLLFVTLGAGALQVLTGTFRLGRFISLVPIPVIAGFTAGIGAIILLGQYPRALGLPPPDPSHVCDVFTHAREIFQQASPSAAALALFTLMLTFLLPRLSPRIPAALVAVAVPAFAAFALGLNVEKVGAIPSSLPLPSWPALPSAGIGSLLASVFAVYALASLETLLSSTAVDKIAKGASRHNPNQELVGQGLGNMASALFGGIPATGVIARSALNVHSGARTRRAAIVHSLVVLAIVFLLAPVVQQIPIPVLAGMLLSVAVRMLNPRELVDLWKLSRPNVAIYVVTFAVIVSVDLIAGVEAGIAAAVIVAALRASRTQSRLTFDERSRVHRATLSGNLTFLSPGLLDEWKHAVPAHAPDRSRGVIFDLSELADVDVTGAERLLDFVRNAMRDGTCVVLLGAADPLRKLLAKLDKTGALQHTFATTEAEATERLRIGPTLRPIHRLRHGVQSYRDRRGRFVPLFKQLATGQRPHTLFITCSDSRIDPGLITSTRPGELLVVRNIGNIVPPYERGEGFSEAAAIEFAVKELKVSEIVVCGHSGCGAVRAALEGRPDLEHVSRWLSIGANCPPYKRGARSLDHAARANAEHQLEHLRTYPIIRDALAGGRLEIHAWFFDISNGEVEERSHGGSGKADLSTEKQSVAWARC